MYSDKLMFGSEMVLEIAGGVCGRVLGAYLG